MDIGMIRAVLRGLNLGPILTFLAGLLVGLVVFGWWLTPVSYFDGAPQDLRAIDYQQYYLRGLADQYAFNQIDANAAVAALDAQNWPDAAAAICDAANRAAAGSLDSNGNTIVAASPVSVQRLNNLVEVLGGGNCDQINAGGGIPAVDGGEAPAAESAGGGIGRWLTALGWLIVLGLLVGAFWWLWNRDSSDYADDDNLYPATPPNTKSSGSSAGVASQVDSFDDVGDFAGDPPATDSEGGIVPISTYRTTYSYGQDAYDDSFSIENGAGEFLGECGVGISETMGSGSNRAVSALEVWLFDKNDIRTITKVAMSEHIWMDEAVRAKLEPKGEPVMVRPEEVIVLETASLIINARITELEYGSNPELPENSYFERLSVEMSAWAKNDAGGGEDSFDFE